MKNISILFPDSVHFHSKNFKSLFDFIERHKIKHTFIDDRREWVSAYGDYSSYTEELSVYIERLNENSLDELLSINVNGVNLFDVCRDEALTYYLPKSDFRNQVISFPIREELIKIMWETDCQSLILNMSAAWSWCDFWSERLGGLKNHTYVMIFSGAQIYNRTLLEILKTHPSTPLVMEHFFTGNEYYLEERYSPIPNNSDIKHSNYYNAIKINAENEDLNRLRVKAINKVILSKNKNVKQPSFSEIIPSKNRDIITIVGQVVNDFSVICTATKYLSTIDFYINLIDGLLKSTDCFVVFKAHPWERNKNNVKSALTYDEINNYINGLSIDLQERIYITEDFNLQELIKQSKHVVTLCSQSAIEAAFSGLKSIQFGNAFYGNKAFTYDFNDIDDFINEYKCGKLNPYLTLNEYDSFELFLVKVLEKNLVSVFNSGILSLEKKLFVTAPIPLAKVECDTNVDSFPTTTVSVVQPKIISQEKKIEENKVTKVNVPSIQSKNKKIAKFRRDPKKFFLDSKYKTLNMIGRVFY